jgi:hypothetical protein
MTVIKKGWKVSRPLSRAIIQALTFSENRALIKSGKGLEQVFSGNQGSRPAYLDLFHNYEPY